MPVTRPARNMLFIMSDEHNKRVLGAAGHPIIRTPNLDRLAANGVRFSDAYCNSPICVPSRASFHTGRYVHDIRFWDNAIPYDGSVASWAHRLRDAGHRVDSIGKLHFRSEDDDNGFTQEHIPLHVVGGIGAPNGLVRVRRRGARPHCVWQSRQDRAIWTISATTTTSRRRPSNGSRHALLSPMKSRGACSYHWCARTFH